MHAESKSMGSLGNMSTIMMQIRYGSSHLAAAICQLYPLKAYHFRKRILEHWLKSLKNFKATLQNPLSKMASFKRVKFTNCFSQVRPTINYLPSEIMAEVLSTSHRFDLGIHSGLLKMVLCNTS